MVGMISPAIAIASDVSAREIEVKIPRVQAVTRSDGSIQIDTGNSLNVSSRASSWNPFRNWRLPWRSYRENRHSGCRQSSYQAIKTTPSGKKIQSNSQHNRCY